MRDMIGTFLTRMSIDRRGVTAVEYAIIAGVLGAVVFAAFTTLGGSISSTLGAVTF